MRESITRPAHRTAANVEASVSIDELPLKSLLDVVETQLEISAPYSEAYDKIPPAESAGAAGKCHQPKNQCNTLVALQAASLIANVSSAYCPGHKQWNV